MTVPEICGPGKGPSLEMTARNYAIWEAHKHGGYSKAAVGRAADLSREQIRRIIEKIDRRIVSAARKVHCRAHKARVQELPGDDCYRGLWLDMDGPA